MSSSSSEFELSTLICLMPGKVKNVRRACIDTEIKKGINCDEKLD